MRFVDASPFFQTSCVEARSVDPDRENFSRRQLEHRKSAIFVNGERRGVSPPVRNPTAGDNAVGRDLERRANAAPLA